MPTAKETAKTTTPLDPSRTMGMDQRDPRALRQQWPCVGHHVPGKAQSNKFASWTHCAQCDIRLEYVLKKGAPATHMQAPNQGNVKKALDQLQHLLPVGDMPTAAVIRASLEKVAPGEPRPRNNDEQFQKPRDTQEGPLRPLDPRRLLEKFLPKLFQVRENGNRCLPTGTTSTRLWTI